jgi:hypothetical protein
MRCSNGHKLKVSRLMSLSGESELSYLVALEYRKPITLFGWPLYWLRCFFMSNAKISFSEVESILWEELKTSWRVKLISGSINGIDNINNFVLLKKTYYADKEA